LQQQQQQEQQQHMPAVRYSSPVELLEHTTPSHSLSNGGGRQVRGSMEVQYGGHHFFQLPEWIDRLFMRCAASGRPWPKQDSTLPSTWWLAAGVAGERDVDF
jgi:hypothetical protein